jgi:hypothetical protein
MARQAYGPHSFLGALGLMMRERVYHKLTKQVVSFHRRAKVKLFPRCSACGRGRSRPSPEHAHRQAHSCHSSCWLACDWLRGQTAPIRRKSGRSAPPGHCDTLSPSAQSTSSTRVSSAVNWSINLSRSKSGSGWQFSPSPTQPTTNCS